jgi:hypothetical protein
VADAGGAGGADAIDAAIVAGAIVAGAVGTDRLSTRTLLDALFRSAIDEAGRILTLPRGLNAFKASFKQHFGNTQQLLHESHCNSCVCFVNLATSLTFLVIAVLLAKPISMVLFVVH